VSRQNLEFDVAHFSNLHDDVAVFHSRVRDLASGREDLLELGRNFQPVNLSLEEGDLVLDPLLDGHAAQDGLDPLLDVQGLFIADALAVVATITCNPIRVNFRVQLQFLNSFMLLFSSRTILNY
jgi:hypothetical protein